MHPILEKKLFSSDENAIDKEKENKGYVFGAHAKEDAVRNKDKRLPITKDMCAQTLKSWMKFIREQKLTDYELGPGCQTPDYMILKEFFRWYIYDAKGRKAKNGRPVMSSVLNCAERLFGGFEETMGIIIVKEDRREIFNWIRKTLTAKEREIEDIHTPKLSFSKTDFLRTVSSLWQTDHNRFIPGLLKVTILLTLQLFLFTGARIGAFIPAHKNKEKRGLRYKHIDLVLFPSSTAPWKIEWKVDQVWLKNNRNPDYTVFGIGIRDSKKPQFAAGYILLALALNHGALYGIDSAEDLAQFDLSNGPLPLRWKDEYLEKPVLRHVTAEGPHDIPLTKAVFCECLRVMFTAAGYSERRPTVHDIRNHLGKKVEGRYGSALVSQIYGHKDSGTYAKDYVLHCSSINTVATVLDEDPNKDGGSDHIEYFQGFDRFYEPGLPSALPAEIERSVQTKPELLEIQGRIEHLQAKNGDKTLIRGEKINYKKALLRNRLFELKRYQSQWVRERRDQRIILKGKRQPPVIAKNVITRAQALFMPETARIATLMSCTRELTFDEMLLFVQDLRAQCARDFDVVYLPGEAPSRGLCPAKDCQTLMARLSKHERSAHIHACVRRKIAVGLQVAEEALLYCYECMDWILNDKWPEHCRNHIQSWTTQHCEIVTYRHTIIRPGYCPFCLWKKDLPEDERMRYWTRSDNLRQHIEEQHLRRIQFPTADPICGCNEIFRNEDDLRNHLYDIHGLKKAIWMNEKRLKGKKCGSRRKQKLSSAAPEGDHLCSFSTLEDSKVPTTVCPEQLEHVDAWKSPGPDSRRVDTACVPITSHSIKSRQTEAETEFIDPRILQPVETFDQIQTMKHMLSPTAQMDPDQAKSFIHSPRAPIQSLALQSTIGSESDVLIRSPETPHSEKCMEPEQFNLPPLKDERRAPSMVEDDCERDSSTPPDDQRCSHAEIQQAFSTGHDQLHCEAIIEMPRTRAGKRVRAKQDVPPTRAVKRARPVQHVPDRTKEDKRQIKLNAKDKRRLCELKSQGFTLRQVGPQFSSIDETVLRQAWEDLRPSQRLTRSRFRERR